MMNTRDIATCCGFAVSQEVLDVERSLLTALGYRLDGPTAHTFVEHFTRRHVDQEVRRRAHAIADSSLFDHRCVKLLPSAMAAAAVLLARMCLEPAPHAREQVRRWSRDLEGMTGYKPMDMYDGLDCMYNTLPVLD
ncbi:putative cyclin-F2-1 [Miscanthus floridulus]|uniref:putative cyclin-F2-1 n=1 Tax=Miscanthus floridulus TaxID=154761 RepID=UPI0034577A7D